MLLLTPPVQGTQSAGLENLRLEEEVRRHIDGDVVWTVVVFLILLRHSLGCCRAPRDWLKQHTSILQI